MSNISLAEMLQRKTPPERPVQIEVLRQVAAQLDQAHQRNLTHGNLSPHSILISELGSDGAVSVFVKDFGSKFDIDPAAMGGAPPPHAYYLSPEQVLGIDIGPQSDEFAFAVIAYELVSGGLPFSAPKLSGLIFAICSDPPTPIYDVDPWLSAAVQSIFARALAKDRESRFPSCWAFASALIDELGRSQPWRPAEVRSEAIPVAAAAAVTARPAPLHAEPPPAPAAPAWNGTPVFEPSSVPPRADFELPSVRRRNRYEEEEPAPGGSPLKKIAIAGLILFALAGAGFYFLNGPRTPDLPTQVLDTKNAPVTAPPADSGSKTTQSAASPAVQPPAPAPTASAPAASGRTATENSAPAVQTAQSQPPSIQAPASQFPSSQSPSTQSRSTQPVPQPAPASADPRSAPLPRVQRSAALTQSQPSQGLVDIELLSDPPGASILIDNNAALACKAPCNISLSTGRHTLSANLPGYTLAQRIFNVPETTSVFVTMPRLTGALVVTSNPSAATILIDGKDYGLTPATLHLPPGQHRVTLMNGSQMHNEFVTVVADGIQASGYTFPR